MPPLLVRRIALDVLQRPPTAAEAAAWSAKVPAELATELLATEEAMACWLEEELLYFLLLDNFRPTGDGVASLPARLQARRTDVRGATAEILLSTGFSLRNPGNDTFVTVVLEQCLGLEVQDRRNAPLLEAGKKVYDGYATRFLGGTGATQADVVRLALADRAFSRHLLDRHHRRLFAQPLPARASALVDLVHASPRAFFDVLAQWLASEGYTDPGRPRRPLSHQQFARSLYQDLLGRLPTYEEHRMVRNALLAMADPAPLRAVLVKVMLDSGRCKLPAAPAHAAAQDFGREDFVRECFVRYLRREATAEEVAAFTSELAGGPSDRVGLVVRTLVASPEYASY
jgi:hypothetical protein